MKRLLPLTILLLVACSPVRHEGPPLAGSPAARSVASYAESLLGTPYRYGGSSPDTGFDCSGFVDHVYRHSLGIKLPHSSHKISRFGRFVSMQELRTGDLVFFDTQHSKYSHVGIYLGGDRFIHAPSSGGRVRTENIRDRYWKTRYDGARRVI